MLLLLYKAFLALLGLNTLSYLSSASIVNWGVVVIVIIFQPEIRAMLEKFGKSNSILGSNVSKEEQINMIEELVRACRADVKDQNRGIDFHSA